MSSKAAELLLRNRTLKPWCAKQCRVGGSGHRPKISPADVFVIAVPTPLKGDHEPDLGCLREAANSVAGVLVAGNLVVLESTSPVGTTEALCEWLEEARPDLSFPHLAGVDSDIRVAYSPERVLPGDILNELVNNDRIVGGITPACAQQARSLYEIFVSGECSVTTARTAELVKLTENAYRDVNIAFANEISLVCDMVGVDPWELIELANRHPARGRIATGSGGRRTLHRSRPMVRRPLRTGTDTPDPGSTPSQ